MLCTVYTQYIKPIVYCISIHYTCRALSLVLCFRLSAQGVRPVGQNTALLSVLENHMVKFSIPQYTLDDLAKVSHTILFDT